jgi:hypothetical protein
MATTLKLIHAISKIWPTIAADPGQSSYHTPERSQFLLSQGVIHFSVFPNCGWFQVPCVVTDIHVNRAIFILRKAASAVAERSFFDLPNRKAVEDGIHSFLAFVRVGEEQVIHMRTHHSGKMLILAKKKVRCWANL